MAFDDPLLDDAFDDDAGLLVACALEFLAGEAVVELCAGFLGESDVSVCAAANPQQTRLESRHSPSRSQHRI